MSTTEWTIQPQGLQGGLGRKVPDSRLFTAMFSCDELHPLFLLQGLTIHIHVRVM
jgi:hypothetical protein